MLLEAVKNGALFVCDRVTFCASASVAEPVTEIEAFSGPLAVAGAVMTGFRFVFAIVRVVVTGVAVPTGVPLSTADQLIVYVPACEKFGVPVSVMLGAANGPALLEAVKNGALFVCDSVTKLPTSGSDAEPVTETEAFSAPLAVAGAVITGFWLPTLIVSAVVAGAAVPAGVFASTAVQLIV